MNALHYAFALDADVDAIVMAAVHAALRAGRKVGLAAPETFHHPSRVLHDLRCAKHEDELVIMREAARLTAEAHTRAMALAAPGRREFEVEAALIKPWLDAGATGVAYTPIVAAGANGTVLHYITNRDELRDGELLLIDAGAEVGYYACDVTRTFPINGRFTAPQRAVYEVVLRAQQAAIDCCRAGNRFTDVHQAAVRALTEGMVELGLLSTEHDPVNILVDDKAYEAYYPHGTSHWLGLDVHDAGAYARDGEATTFVPGMVLTVEPGIYVPADDEGAPEALRGIAVRIEDDVLVTEGDPEVLTAAIPKQVEDVEAACRAGAT